MRTWTLALALAQASVLDPAQALDLALDLATALPLKIRRCIPTFLPATWNAVTVAKEDSKFKFSIKRLRQSGP